MAKSTFRNQTSLEDKTLISLRLPSYDYKVIKLLAIQNDITVSKQISNFLASLTAQTKTLFSEIEIDKAIIELTEKKEQAKVGNNENG